MAKAEVLGEVTTPSGVVVVLDTGLMWLWSHDRPPVMAEGRYGAETEQAANSAADFQLVGPDAEAAGKAFDRQGHPCYLFDLPEKSWSSIRRMFRECVREHGFDVRLVRLKERVTHRARVDLALAYGNGAGPVQYQGLWAAAVGGVPADR